MSEEENTGAAEVLTDDATEIAGEAPAEKTPETIAESSAETPATPAVDGSVTDVSAAASLEPTTPQAATSAAADATAPAALMDVVPTLDGTATTPAPIKRAPRTYVGLQRVAGTIKVLNSGAESLPMQCRILLSDLSETGLGCFTERSLSKEQEVDVVIELPDGALRFPSRTVWCREQPTTGRIVSAHAFKFRVGVQFNFDSPEQKTSLITLLSQIKRHPSSKTKR